MKKILAWIFIVSGMALAVVHGAPGDVRKTVTSDDSGNVISAPLVFSNQVSMVIDATSDLHLPNYKNMTNYVATHGGGDVYKANNQTFTGTNTFNGFLNGSAIVALTNGFGSGGTVIGAAYLSSNQTFTGNNTFNGTLAGTGIVALTNGLGGTSISSAGAGTSLVYSATQVKSLIPGGNITLTDNGTTVTVASAGGAGEANTSSTSGSAYPLTLAKVGVDLPFRGVAGSSSILVSTNADTLTLTYSNANDYVTSSFVSGAYLPLTGNWIGQGDLYVTNSGSRIAGRTFQIITNDSGLTGAGMLTWNSTDLTANLGLNAGTTLQIGQENLIHARNAQTGGITITNGKAVYLSGATGDKPSVKLANASASTTSHGTVGVATEDIANGQVGFITTLGLVRDIDTSAWDEGDMLYVSTADGQISNSPPAVPNHRISIGTVVRKNASTGMIFVRPQDDGALSEVADVTIANPAAGHTLVYNGTGNYWTNAVPFTTVGGANTTTTTNGTLITIAASGGGGSSFTGPFYVPMNINPEWNSDGSTSSNIVAVLDFTTFTATNSICAWGTYSSTNQLQDIYRGAHVQIPPSVTAFGTTAMVFKVYTSATGVATNKINLLITDPATYQTYATNSLVGSAANTWTEIAVPKADTMFTNSPAGKCYQIRADFFTGFSCTNAMDSLIKCYAQ